MTAVAPNSAPTTWHQDVPRGRRANLRWRRRVWPLAERNRHVRAALWERCRQDVLFWINGFFWLYDPNRPAVLPWTTWPYQDRTILDIVEAIRSGQDRLIEKSRDMGASWMVLGVFLWLWLFEPMSALGVISRLRDLVDKSGDPDALFWKLRFTLYRLPAWMQPPVNDVLCHLGNAANGSTIDGYATTGDAARGGRRRAILMDEHAHLDDAEALEAATADASRCRIRLSTPRGAGTVFGQLRRSGRVAVRTLHWREHPQKSRGLYTSEGGRLVRLDDYAGPVMATRLDPETGPRDETVAFPGAYPFVLDGKLRSPWYDRECTRRASLTEVAQELDIDYLRSGHIWFDADVVARIRAKHVRPADLRGAVAWTLGPTLDLHVDRFHATPNGPLALWVPLVGPEQRPSQIVNYVVGADVGLGTGASNSAASIVDVNAGRKVGELVTAEASPEMFARQVVAMCLWLGGATGRPYLVWEANGPGLIFGREVVRLKYGYIHWRRREDLMHPRSDGSGVPGWHSGEKTKALLLGDYRRDLALGTFINPSGPAVDELLQYVVDAQGNPVHESLVEETSGARKAHGDRVIADALANLGRTEQPRAPVPPKPVPERSYQAMREQWERAQRDASDE